MLETVSKREVQEFDTQSLIIKS